MKKTILLIALTALFTPVFAQWQHRTIKSDFDGNFKKAYTETNNLGYLAMEAGDNPAAPFIYLRGAYFCDENTRIDIVFFLTPETTEKFSVEVLKSDDNKYYYFPEDVWTESFIAAFKNSSIIKLRVKQSYCEDVYYEFSMKGSTAALNFVSSVN